MEAWIRRMIRTVIESIPLDLQAREWLLGRIQQRIQEEDCHE